MSSMSFDSAVRALVRIHTEEISNLQQQLVQSLSSNTTVFGENADEFVVPRELHACPQILSTPKHMPSTPAQLRFTPSLMPSPPRQTPTTRAALCSSADESQVFSPAEHPRLVSQPNTANRNEEIGETSSDGQCLNDCQELHDSWLKKWIVLVHGVLTKRESVCTAREGWSKLSKRKTRTPEFQAKLDFLNHSLVRSQRWGRSRHTKRSMRGFLSQSLGHFQFRQSYKEARVSCYHRYQLGMLVAHPESFKCRAWSLLTCLVVLYEIAAITMKPFDVFARGGLRSLETISGIFWILDIILTFFTGVYINGRLEVRLCVIAKRYLRTWFSFDLTVAVMHLLTTLANTSAVFARCVRVLRLGRMVAWTRTVLATFQSRSAMFWAKVAQCLVALYFFVHFNACLWYEIGQGANGWVSEYHRLGRSAGEKYLVAMHLSLSQLQGSADIYPGTSVHDRVYVVASSFASIIFLALLVSIMTDALFTAQTERKVLNNQMRMVRSFFDRHNVKPALRNRADYYLRSLQNANDSAAHEDQDRQALEVFPLQLRLRLLAESRAPIISWHPMFSYLQDFHMTIFTNICTDGVSWRAYQPDDDIFTSGKSSTGAYYIASGDFVYNARFDVFGALNPWLDHFMDYSTMPGSTKVSCSASADRLDRQSTSSVEIDAPSYREMLTHSAQNDKRSVQRLQMGQMVAEISLWSSWVHTGDMSSVSHGQCFNIHWAELIALIAQSSQPYELFAAYAARFASSAENLRGIGWSDQMIELMGFADIDRIEVDFIEDAACESQSWTLQASS